MGDHDDRLAHFFIQAREQIKHGRGGRRVEVAGRLIGNKDARICNQCPGNGDSLLLPPGQLSRIMRVTIGNPRQLSFVINQIPGVVENGLFIDICDVVIVGYGDGRVTTRDITNNAANVIRFDILDDDNIFVDISD